LVALGVVFSESSPFLRFGVVALPPRLLYSAGRFRNLDIDDWIFEPNDEGINVCENIIYEEFFNGYFTWDGGLKQHFWVTLCAVLTYYYHA
jgi:hypothetical protein